MGAVGGPPETLSLNGREFRCTGDADVSRELGGHTATYESNGDGSTRKIMVPVPWSLGGVSIEIDSDNSDQEYINDVKNSQDDVDVLISYTDGSSYTARGGIDGEAPYSNSSASATFDLKGPGKLKKL